MRFLILFITMVAVGCHGTRQRIAHSCNQTPCSECDDSVIRIQTSPNSDSHPCPECGSTTVVTHTTETVTESCSRLALGFGWVPIKIPFLRFYSVSEPKCVKTETHCSQPTCKADCDKVNPPVKINTSPIPGKIVKATPKVQTIIPVSQSLKPTQVTPPTKELRTEITSVEALPQPIKENIAIKKKIDNQRQQMEEMQQRLRQMQKMCEAAEKYLPKP